MKVVAKAVAAKGVAVTEERVNAVVAKAPYQAGAGVVRAVAVTAVTAMAVERAVERVAARVAARVVAVRAVAEGTARRYHKSPRSSHRRGWRAWRNCRWPAVAHTSSH